MRVVVLLVVVCGCRVAASSPVDAAIPRGDGLPERIVTDAALWADVAISGNSDGAPIDRTSTDQGSTGAADTGTARMDSASADAGGPCALLGTTTCVGDEACYPFPFEGTPNGDTRCAFQGVGQSSVPCQSQLECDGTTLCSAPGDPDSICLRRCDSGNARCPTGMQCVAFFSYVGVGVCR